MLTISTIPEALAELENQTGRAWTESELFDLATKYGVELHAAAPVTAVVTVQKFVDGVGMVEKFRSPPGHAALAVLFPPQVGQLWVCGETTATHTANHDEIEGENRWFTEPVRVTREQVRIKAATLKRILTIWRKENQAPEQTATPGPEVASEGTAPAVPNWKMRVQTEATELFIRLLASGANPTQHSILDSMVTWCCNHEIKTDGKNGGINPSRGYLRTHVLGGGHWTPPTMSREQAKKHVAQVAQTKVAQVAQQHT